jgi:hypothetical protein
MGGAYQLKNWSASKSGSVSCRNVVENPAKLTVVCSVIYGILECAVNIHWCLHTLEKLQVCKTESYLGLFRMYLEGVIFCRNSGRPCSSESDASSSYLDFSPSFPPTHLFS